MNMEIGAVNIIRGCLSSMWKFPQGINVLMYDVMSTCS